MNFKNNAFEILEDRGFIKDATHLDELKKLLKSGPITFYLGIDPTADSLHIGHFFAMQMFRILQDCGHKGILLVGGATAMVGDPSFKCDMRKMLSQEEVDKNAKEIDGLVRRFIKVDGDNPAIIVNNADWIKNQDYVSFLRKVGVHFNISKMLACDSYKNRLANGLTFLEMGYMLMQAYDFVHLNDKYNCVFQIGGSDQWANIVAGVDLSRKMANEQGKERQLMMGLCCPLLTNADGIKMGKTEKGTLWVSREKTLVFDFFQHFVNCLDADVERLLRFFTKIEVAEIQRMCKEDIVKAKKLMAFEVTKLVHGEEEAKKTLEIANNLFSTGNSNSENMPTETISGNGKINILDFLSKLSIIKSKSEAKRLVEQNGIMIDNQKMTDINELIDLSKKELVVKKGKKTFVKVLVTEK